VPMRVCGSKGGPISPWRCVYITGSAEAPDGDKDDHGWSVDL
jgi:hypothetical protein